VSCQDRPTGSPHDEARPVGSSHPTVGFGNVSGRLRSSTTDRFVRLVDGRLRLASVGLVATTALLGVGTEIAVLSGYFDPVHPASGVVADAHYLVVNAALFVATSLLAVGWVARRSVALAHGGLAIGVWLLAHLYWTTYVYLAGVPLTYPSVAELGFQAFYLLVVPLSCRVLDREGLTLSRSSFVAVVGFVAVAVSGVVWSDLRAYQLAYSAVYLGLVGATLALGLTFVRHRRRTAFGVGLTLFAGAEAAYIVVALVDHTVAVPYLDPLWYLGAALLANALLAEEDDTETDTDVNANADADTSRGRGQSRGQPPDPEDVPT
jgi:hypothetical protein